MRDKVLKSRLKYRFYGNFEKVKKIFIELYIIQDFL